MEGYTTILLVGGPLDGGEVYRRDVFQGGFVTPIAEMPCPFGSFWEHSERGPYVVTYKLTGGRLQYQGRRVS